MKDAPVFVRRVKNRLPAQPDGKGGMTEEVEEYFEDGETGPAPSFEALISKCKLTKPQIQKLQVAWNNEVVKIQSDMGARYQQRMQEK